MKKFTIAKNKKYIKEALDIDNKYILSNMTETVESINNIFPNWESDNSEELQKELFEEIHSCVKHSIHQNTTNSLYDDFRIEYIEDELGLTDDYEIEKMAERLCNKTVNRLKKFLVKIENELI